MQTSFLTVIFEFVDETKKLHSFSSIMASVLFKYFFLFNKQSKPCPFLPFQALNVKTADLYQTVEYVKLKSIEKIKMSSFCLLSFVFEKLYS